MKRIISLTLSLIIVLALGSDSIYARTPSKKTPQTQQSQKTVVKAAKTKEVSKLPSKSVTVRLKGVDYYRSGSKYYKKVGLRYVLTPPPFGLRVSIIPAIHTIIRFNNINYYCAEGVIYRPTSGDEFEVVEPQIGMVVPQLPEVNVQEVIIDGKIYFEFDNILYKQIPTTSGLQYEVIGTLSL